MIYVTGDIHGEHGRHRLSPEAFPEQADMTKDDYLIVAGDFGFVWNMGKEDRRRLEWLSRKSFTTLFVDGNHENFDLLNGFPVTEWHGGKVHEVAPGVYHLMRGQVFEICGLKLFTFGGAASHDRWCRTEGVSWWPQEMPTQADFEEAERNLDKHGWKVDYVVTHCAPDTVLDLIDMNYGHDMASNILGMIDQRLEYREWIMGHYHVNHRIDSKHIILYEQIARII